VRRHRVTPLEYVYVVLLAAVAAYGFVSRGYVPTVPPRSDVFQTVTVAAGGSARLSTELYQPIDLLVPVPPGQLLGRASLFDAHAVATFSNAATGDTFVTHAFYDGGADGNAVYRFRFTPTSLGSWALSTVSDVPALDGVEGGITVVPSSDADRRGFLGSAFGRFAVPVASSQAPVAVPYQVYYRGGWPLEDLGSLPRDEQALRLALADLLDEAATNGFDAVLVGVWHQWFELGTSRSDRHFSVSPDPATFRVLETLASMAHERGMFLHIWQWGDRPRAWSPRGILADARVEGDSGGVGGVADLRLQRYIAARLGPLPNWTLSYGFDLNEWADEDAVRDWSEYLLAHSARPHLLTGMEVRRSPSNVFDLGEETLGLISKTRIAEAAIDGASASGGSVPMVLYDAAIIERAAAREKPVIFETRYLHLRDGVWTMDRTRRAMWSLSMAGGVAAIWGVDWDLQAPYPHPEQLRTHRAFWTRWPLGDGSSAAREDGSLVLLSADGDRAVVYAVDSDVVVLPPIPHGASVWAVDTLLEYAELDVTPAGDGAGATWRAPYVSDWAVAVGPRP